MKLTKQRLREIIREELQAVVTEDLGSGIQWSKHNLAPSGMRGDVYNAEDEEIIQQALGPEYYVAKYQYGASGMTGQEAQQAATAEFNKYVARPTPGPGGEIVVMPQKTLEGEGGRVHYFKMAHDRDEDGNMYAKLVT